MKTNIDVLNYTPKGDLLVVNAARCSFDKQHEEFDKEKDAKLHGNVHSLAEIECTSTVNDQE